MCSRQKTPSFPMPWAVLHKTPWVYQNRTYCFPQQRKELAIASKICRNQLTSQLFPLPLSSSPVFSNTVTFVVSFLCRCSPVCSSRGQGREGGKRRQGRAAAGRAAAGSAGSKRREGWEGSERKRKTWVHSSPRSSAWRTAFRPQRPSPRSTPWPTPWPTGW